jgi:hypothetical protein
MIWIVTVGRSFAKAITLKKITAKYLNSKLLLDCICITPQDERQARTGTPPIVIPSYPI